MNEIKRNLVLIDTYNRKEEDYYDSFKEYVKDICGWVVKGKENGMYAVNEDNEVEYTFNDFYEHQCEIEGTDFWEQFQHAQEEHYPVKCVITGTLGLWDGKHTIVPTCMELYEAIVNCLKDAYEYVIKIEDGIIIVENHHHDGTNICEIRLINSDVYDKIIYWNDEIDGDLIDFLSDKNNWEKIYYEYFGL